MNEPKVSIIILNWNGWKDTLECLESLYQIDYSNYNVIIVDNDSKDNSIGKIRQYCKGELKIKSDFFKYTHLNKPINILEFKKSELNTQIPDEFLNLPSNKKIVLIKNDENYGFSEGNNVAIRFILKNMNSDYIFLLNNDTVVHKDFLKELVKLAESDEKIIVTGPKVYYYDFKGKTDIIQCTGGYINLNRFPGYFLINLHKSDIEIASQNIECDWTTGAGMLIKINESPIKYLNKEFYFGLEDIDLCLKLKKKGHKIAIAMNSKIWHKGGVSRFKKYSKTELIKKNFSHIKYLKALNNNNFQYYVYLPFYMFGYVLSTIMFLLFMSKKRIIKKIKEN